MPPSSSASPDPDGRLLVVSGPSGVGKSSVVHGVLARTGARFSVSVTTRAPRVGEREGIEYHFVDDETFDRLLEEGALLEWAEYGGHRYGTLRAEVDDRLAAGEDVVLDIENEGARQIRELRPDAILVFLLPPSREDLEERLRARGDTDPEDVARRLAVADRQIAEASEIYDHLVVNADLGHAIAQVVSILERAGRDQQA